MILYLFLKSLNKWITDNNEIFKKSAHLYLLNFYVFLNFQLETLLGLKFLALFPLVLRPL